MSLRDAAQQALEALKIAQDDCIHGEMAEASPIFQNAIHALEATLAEPQPEIEQLKAERDALLADADLHRNRCASILFSGAMDNVTAGEVHQWMRDYVDAKAERDALLAAAEKGTEYVLAHINQDLRAERDALLADAERYRWLRENKFKHNGHCFALTGPILWEETLDAAIDAARGKP